MAYRDYKAFIVEGEAREPLIISNISNVFFRHSNFKIITLPAGQNIYMIWKKLKKDDFDTDIIEVLREENEEIEKQLTGFQRDDFSEVYLFFDYDGHQNNLIDVENENVLDQMLLSFDNETENGKLYISYPMVEALRDFEPDLCGNNDNCFLDLEQSKDYKNISSDRALYPHFKSYNFNIWRNVIEVFVMRLACLMNQNGILEYDGYKTDINPREIFRLETNEIVKSRIFILSAFPEFLLDYFGIKLWKTCVKHTTNQLGKAACPKDTV